MQTDQNQSSLFPFFLVSEITSVTNVCLSPPFLHKPSVDLDKWEYFEGILYNGCWKRGILTEADGEAV